MPISETLLTRVSRPSRNTRLEFHFRIAARVCLHCESKIVQNREGKRREIGEEKQKKRHSKEIRNVWPIENEKELIRFEVGNFAFLPPSFNVDQRYPCLSNWRYLKLFETEYRESNISIIEVNIIREYRFVSWLDQILFTVHEYIIENGGYWPRYYWKEKNFAFAFIHVSKVKLYLFYKNYSLPSIK